MTLFGLLPQNNTRRVPEPPVPPLPDDNRNRKVIAPNQNRLLRLRTTSSASTAIATNRWPITTPSSPSLPRNPSLQPCPPNSWKTGLPFVPLLEVFPWLTHKSLYHPCSPLPQTRKPVITLRLTSNTSNAKSTTAPKTSLATLPLIDTSKTSLPQEHPSSQATCT